ncbi:hypothetical protein DFAR_3170002 [Desulfarculales bacterium]
MQTAKVFGVIKRFEYATRLGALALATGDVGGGKTTALRWVASRRHPSEYQVIWITASQGSILEFYRQICVELEVDTTSFSKAVLTKFIRKQILEVAQDRKKQSVLIIDEASLLRLEVLAELHNITQFQGDSKPILPIILAGQNNLADLLIYRTSFPLASRIVAGAIWPASPSRTCRTTFCITSKLQVSNRTSSLIRPASPYSRAPAASS